ncbi:murein transglycosylase [Amycolatopsis sp. GM8]|uniref:murein transglycosylase n=1 Tax=Amycolatopsis sp. GM8 TaxID=2896530 RepID=UPI001F2BA371|nr:murein transglycosylase [Amycolatopsis sp. GM8]
MTSTEEEVDTPPSRAALLVVWLVLAFLILAVGGGAMWVLRAGDTGIQSAADSFDSVTEQPPAPGASVQNGLNGWAARMAGATGVPARALVGYGNAEIATRTLAPGCHLSWSTLAGIGRVESDHGRFGGTELGADGRPRTPIIGPALDGSPGMQRIPATDGGALTGDPVWEHAVGPLQFLPSTWDTWGTRAGHDGRKPDPQNIDDAALSAARYLCADQRDLSTSHGWWSAMLSYNGSVDYAQQVFAAANSYALASRR